MEGDFQKVEAERAIDRFRGTSTLAYTQLNHAARHHLVFGQA